MLVALVFLGCETNRCSTCNDCPNGVQLESEVICEDDFSSADSYDQAVELAESFGCTCE